MAILQNDNRIEQIEYSAGITDIQEFVYENNPDIAVPSGIEFHKIITKNKQIVYQTLSSPAKHSEIIIRKRNLTDFEGYLEATDNNPPTSFYFRNKKVEPKPVNYKKGFFDRFFVQLASDTHAPILEIEGKDFKVADATYAKVKIRWSLSSNPEEQEELNRRAVDLAEEKFPQIRHKIYNLIEFG
jgi:hypothetical protein|tara:strand:- start:9608 stop:10162 length:555 start_codon:yes stop_codon:yes gene_type:complete